MLNESLLMKLLEIRNGTSSFGDKTAKILETRQGHHGLSENEFIYHIELSSLVFNKLLEIRFISNGDYKKLTDELNFRGVNLPAAVLVHLEAWDRDKYQEWVRNR